MSWDTQIVRVSTGFLNTVNDAVIGGVSGVSGSKFAGQLGKAIWVDSTQIATMFTPSPSGPFEVDNYLPLLYAGGYRYVRYSEDADGDIAAGRLLYWDQDAAPGDFVVTDKVDTTTLEYASLAGFTASPLLQGNYFFIQFAGIAQCLYADTITGTKATGRTVVASTSENRTIDILDDLATSGGAPALNTFVGWAITVPDEGELGTFEIARHFTTRQ